MLEILSRRYSKYQQLSNGERLAGQNEKVLSRQNGRWHASMTHVLFLTSLIMFIVCGYILVVFGVDKEDASMASMQALVESLDVPIERIMFSPDVRFTTFNSTSDVSSEDVWKSLFPRSGGFVTSAQAGPFHMPADVPDVHVVSMYHQLHCIQSLAAALLGGEGEAGHHQHHHHHQSRTHIAHCVDYIRQTIMCAGDLSLEPAYLKDVDGVPTPAVTGWGAVHTCKNWDAMFQFTVEHNVNALVVS